MMRLGEGRGIRKEEESFDNSNGRSYDGVATYLPVG
jgi:hypothetical protein